MYYYRSSRARSEDDELDDAQSNVDASWRGCIDLQLATVGMAPENIPGASQILQITTPLRTFILKVFPAVSSPSRSKSI